MPDPFDGASNRWTGRGIALSLPARRDPRDPFILESPMTVETVAAPTWTIEPEFTFTDAEREALEASLSTVTANPYRLYEAHRFQVEQLVVAGAVPERFIRYVETLTGRDRAAEPVVVMKNVPHDRS